MNKLLKFGAMSLVAVLLVMLTGYQVFAFTFDVKGTEVNIGGYAKAMLIYDIGNVNDRTNSPYQGDIFNPYAVVLDDPTTENGMDDRNDFRFSARESRLYFKTRTESDYGLINTHIEGDFYGNSEVNGGSGYETWSNQYAFRLRQAYGAWNKGNTTLLAGQTWSTFMDLPAYTPVMDFNGDVGTTFVRQPMLRYTYSFAKGNSLSLALENPDRGLTATKPPTENDPVFRNVGTAQTEYPDFIAKYWYGGSWGHISPKILIMQYSLSSNDESFKDATAFCGSLTGHLNLGNHKIFFGGMAGDGMGRYGGLGVISGAGLTQNGQIELVPFWSVYLGAQLKLTETVNFNAGAGYSETDKSAYEGSDAVLAGAANKTVRSLRGFFTHRPIPALECALGVVYGDRETMDGRKGDGTRVQGYVQYNF